MAADERGDGQESVTPARDLEAAESVNETVDRLPENDRSQLLPAFEPGCDGRPGHAGPAGEIGHREFVGPPLTKNLVRNFENLLVRHHLRSRHRHTTPEGAGKRSARSIDITDRGDTYTPVDLQGLPSLLRGPGVSEVVSLSSQCLGTVAPGCALVAALWGFAAAQDTPIIRDKRAGFVVSGISYALGPDAKVAGACPEGLTLNLAQAYARTPEGRQRPGEDDGDYERRVRHVARQLATLEGGENICMRPELADRDPNFRTVSRSDIPVPGFDLDGRDGAPADGAGACRHRDFTSPAGKGGVDNQFYRVVGCSASWQTTGPSNGFEVEMLSGSWGILIELGDVDSLVEDDHVTVGIHANADPLMLSPTREALSYATYAIEQDEGYRATTIGQIRGGVLTTDPVDIRLQSAVNSMRLDRPMRDARLEMTIHEDGSFEGFLGGYMPVEDMYNLQYGYRNGRTAGGELAPLNLRMRTANGAAFVLRHTCHGAYQALYDLADGHPDPETGQCTSISAQYRIEGVPAFVVDVDTESLNEELARNADASY